MFLVAHGEAPLAEVVRTAEPGAISPLRHERLLEWFDTFLHTGGLPEVVVAHASGRDHEAVLARMAADYEQDFLRLFGEEQLTVVQACLRAVSYLVGSPFRTTTVVHGASTRVNAPRNATLARLEAWHLVVRADQGGALPGAGHRHLPKQYLTDTGLPRQLRDAAARSIGVVEPAPGLRGRLRGDGEAAGARAGL